MRTRAVIALAALLGGAIGFGLGAGVGRPEPAAARDAVRRPISPGPASPEAAGAVPVGASFATSSDAAQLKQDLEAFHREGVLASTDIPYFQRQMEERAERMAAAYLARNQARYLGLFASLGLAETDSRRLLQFAVHVYKAKAKANNVLTDVLSVQQAYERTAAGLLGPEAFQEYARIEAADQARREVEFLAQHAAERGNPLGAAEQAAVRAIIQDGGAYSAGVAAEFGSPFSPILAPFGPREAVGVYTSRLAALAEQRTRVLATALAQGLPEGTIAALDGYYAKAAADYERMREATTARGRASTLLENAATLRATTGPGPEVESMEQRALELLERSP